MARSRDRGRRSGAGADPVRILGVDPGSRVTGYGVIDRRGTEVDFIACGVIRSTPRLSFPDRLKELADGMDEVVARHRPELCAVEDIFLARNPASALKLGQARGALVITLMRHGLPLREFSAKQVKQAIAGYGQASKAQVQHMVRVFLGLTSAPSEDASDALAVAICLANYLGAGN